MHLTHFVSYHIYQIVRYCNFQCAYKFLNWFFNFTDSSHAFKVNIFTSFVLKQVKNVLIVVKQVIYLYFSNMMNISRLKHLFNQKYFICLNWLLFCQTCIPYRFLFNTQTILNNWLENLLSLFFSILIIQSFINSILWPILFYKLDHIFLLYSTFTS